MDQLQTRLDALEQRTSTVERQLRWWRGLAAGLLALVVLTWALPAGTATDEAATGGEKGLAHRVAALESLLKHFSRKGNDVTIKGANLHIVNGLGSTDCTEGAFGEPIPDCPNGVGNLIVGYNESRARVGEPDTRTGSHNIVVGQLHNFSRFGGVVVGRFNEISGDFAAVSGGHQNTASGFAAAVSGGAANRADGEFAAVSGGGLNRASGFEGSVSGGLFNVASGVQAAVSGGDSNTASGVRSAVSGGLFNVASGFNAAVSGGEQNEASGLSAAVSGGLNRTAAGEFDWVAGTLVEDD